MESAVTPPMAPLPTMCPSLVRLLVASFLWGRGGLDFLSHALLVASSRAK
jgi:hypothetical protein